jgi:predicted RNA binding protein YcfA (HicA-like mRNA interferase family)
MSEIDWSRLRSVTARQIISALNRDGFSLRNQSGSHQRYYHPEGRRVTVTYHRAGDTFRPKTLRSIVEQQARWTQDDLLRLKLLR